MLQSANQVIPLVHRRLRMYRRILTLLALVLALTVPSFAQEHAAHPAPAQAKSTTLAPSVPNSCLLAATKQYRYATREVVKRSPDGLDAATLLAEAGMNLHPWGLWRPDGSPEAGTDEIVSTLESVIRREPNHLGAIHYYIHSVEPSHATEGALAGPKRLAQLAPPPGNIRHLPARLHIRTGDYEAAL